MSYVNHRVNKYILEEKEREKKGVDTHEMVVSLGLSYCFYLLPNTRTYSTECVRGATSTARDSQVGPAVAVISPR